MKIAISTPLDGKPQETFLKLKNNPIFKDAEVHFVHVFRVNYYFNEFSLYSYPMEDQFDEIEKSVVKSLTDLSGKIFSGDVKPKEVKTTCLFHQDTKEKVVEFLKSDDFDLVITATRGKHGIDGLFSSSFTDHLNKFSPCDVYVLRPV